MIWLVAMDGSRQGLTKTNMPGLNSRSIKGFCLKGRISCHAKLAVRQGPDHSSFTSCSAIWTKWGFCRRTAAQHVLAMVSFQHVTVASVVRASMEKQGEMANTWLS